jgi:hypothetical protein
MVFQKIFGGLKDYASQAGDFIKQGAFKYGPAALDFVQGGTGMLKSFPGVTGLVSSGIHHGLKAARDRVSEVQNQDVKAKLENELASSSTPTITTSGVIRSPNGTTPEKSQVPRAIPTNSPGVNTLINPSIDHNVSRGLIMKHLGRRAIKRPVSKKSKK